MLTDNAADDAGQVPALLGQIEGEIASVVASRNVWKWPEGVVSGAVRLAAVRRRGQAGRKRQASRPGSASRRPCAL
jgi:hypothetical protein